MKFLGSQLAYFLSEREVRANIRSLLKYFLLLASIMALSTILFQLIMVSVEGQRHSWLAGLYWTIVTMTTLGYGDIVFHTDAGRAFSSIVLLTGVVVLLVMLPFVFIRFFYAPWLESRVRARAPRELPESIRDHVIIASWDTIAPELVARLRHFHVPYVVLEPNPETAARMALDGVSVVAGEPDDAETYRRLRVDTARLIFANIDDPGNTNITLTARELSARVPIAALATNLDSIDVLELSGVDHVLPLRRQLGEHLANRVNAGHARTHRIGRFHNLVLAEFPVHNTPLRGRTIRDTRLRQVTGASIVAVWDGARLHASSPDYVLTESSVPVVVGTEEQMAALDELLIIYDTNFNPVVIIGGGKVGRAAGRSLLAAEIEVNIIEKKPELRERAATACTRVITGDAADRSVLMAAGFAESPSVLLTTHDDAMNVYLSVYCRRLKPDVRIVSRVTHERNVKAVIRAGADFVLSYSVLGAQAVLSLLHGHEMLVIGQGVDMFRVRVGSRLAGRTLAETRIGERTGLSIVAVEQEGALLTNVPPDFRLRDGSELIAIGDEAQREAILRLNR
jgi:voltage-gated potassium channel